MHEEGWPLSLVDLSGETKRTFTITHFIQSVPDQFFRFRYSEADIFM